MWPRAAAVNTISNIGNDGSSIAQVEVARAWAPARRPGPEVQFLLNKGKARACLS